MLNSASAALISAFTTIGQVTLLGFAGFAILVIGADLWQDQEMRQWETEHPGIHGYWQASWLESFCIEHRWPIFWR